LLAAALPPATYDLAPFGSDHFATARRGDGRRTQSLVDLANRLGKHPHGSLPDQLKDPNALRRLDTALHPELSQIGAGNGNGDECHNSLAVRGQGRRVLGVRAPQRHRRAHAPAGETPPQRRARQDRDSLLWPQGATRAAGVALRLLHLRDRSRDPQLQERPARQVLSPEEVAVLSGGRYGQRRELTTREFLLAWAWRGAPEPPARPPARVAGAVAWWAGVAAARRRRPRGAGGGCR
jgi:hypothetical protein